MIKNLIVITLGIAILLAAELIQLSVSNYVYISLLPIHPAFAAICSDLIQATPAIIPGMVVGLLLQRGQIWAGFICGTIGYYIYYITFDSNGINCLTIGIFIYIAGLCTKDAIGNAFAAGTAQLLLLSLTTKAISPGAYSDSMLHLNTARISRTCLGVAVGAAVYLASKMGERELMAAMDDVFLVNGGSYPAWASGIVNATTYFPAFLCGFTSGWASVTRGILVGFVAGFLGSLSFLISIILIRLLPIQLEFVLSFSSASLMPAIWSGLAGGAAQLLRSNKSVQLSAASNSS